MKSRQTIKKAFGFLGIGSVLVGASCATSIILNNQNKEPVVSHKSQEIKNFAIYNNRRIQTLKDQSIINAISSYSMNPDASNVAQAFQFAKLDGLSIESSLIKEIQAKIKVYDASNPSIIKNIPQECITINNYALDVYNVTIDVGLINGVVAYIDANGVYTQLTSLIWFNATCVNQNSIIYNSGYSVISNSSIGYIIGGVIGAIAILLIAVLIIRKKNANRFTELG